MKKSEAKQLGLKFYMTGKPCKHGHFSNRYTKTGVCVECVKKQSKEWRIKNPQKHKQSMEKWIANNRELHNTRVKRWQRKNKDKCLAISRKWSAENQEKRKDSVLKYRIKNKSKCTAWAVASVARRAKRIPSWLSQDDKWIMQEIYSLAKFRTELTGVPWEVDHIIPLRGKAVSGLHVPNNLQVITKAENRAKRNFYQNF